MKIESSIKMTEVVENKERKFGSNLEYFPAKVELFEGKEVNALFTQDQIMDAINRAARNPEDMPDEHDSFFGWLFS